MSGIKHLADKHLAMYAEGLSLSSVGQYLVFGSSDLSVERKTQFRINCLKLFQPDVAVRIPTQICALRESISKNAFRRFESVYRPEMPEMHLQNFEKL